MAARTEVASLARERDEVLVPTPGGRAPDPGEAVREDAARQKLVGDLTDHGPPVAIRGGEALLAAGVERRKVVLQQAEERGGSRACGA